MPLFAELPCQGLDSFSGSGGFYINLNMWEFFTEWSDNDPKYYVLFIIAGTFFLWLANWNLKKEESEQSIYNLKYLSWAVLGIVLVLYGVFALGRDLIAIL
ncbi:hypothetical protein D7Z94_00755 [Ulvibacterium marinum]|uniref:Uncharacterized protein n=2 Tax=Ulvibacterium marinum TaxID=2419782 RepID=A0A3B0CFB5_9FLAO|nr:hypothetical protein D7Z94_00755 [Ulvibacterium marinum]